MKQYFKSMTFTRAFITFLVLFTILLTAFWAVFYGLLRNSEQQKSIAFCKENSDKLRASLDDVLGVTADISYYLQTADWVNKLTSESDVFGTQFDYSRKLDLERQLRFFTAVYTPVQHISVFYPKRGFCVTSQGWFSNEDYFNYLERKYLLDPDLLEAAVRERKSSTEPYNFNFDYQDDDFLVNMQNLGHLQPPDAIAIIVMSRTGIKAAIQAGLPPNLCSLSVFDENEGLLQEYDLGAAKSRYTIELPSKMLNFNYKFEYGMDLKLSEVGLPLFILFLPVLCLGAVISFLLAKRSSRPVHNLVSWLSAKTKSTDMGIHQEYEFLEHTLETIINENGNLQEKIDRYGNAMRNSLLQQLLLGYFDRGDIDEKLRQFQVPFVEESWFAVLLLRCPEEEILDIADLCPVLQEYFSEQCETFVFEGCETVETYENSEAVIFCGKSRIATEDWAETARDELRQLLQVDFHITCGMTYQGTLGISKSYQDAKQLFSETTEAFYFPEDWKKQFSERLRDGNWESAHGILKELYLENKVRHTGLTGGMPCLKMILEIVIEAAKEVGCEIPSSQLSVGLLGIDDAEAAWEYVLDVGRRVCGFVSDNSTRQIQTLRLELLNYVKQNYCSPTLSLKDMGERFNLSVAAVSRFFKEEAGENFHDYMTELRMEKAKKLLTTIGYNVSYIAKAVGYESEYSFKRAFLKHIGIKPRQYVENGGHPVAGGEDGE